MSSLAPSLPRPRTRRRLDPDRARALVRGRADDPRWVRPALFLVLAAAALLCLWSLTQNGYSNEYYAAAVKSASESWKAWFFGSLDPGSFITVDKPPLSLWLMGLSARVFGFSSFSMLLPEALCTVAAVGLLYTTVRRAFGAHAGLVAAALLALTPITVAIGRVNNPDALLVLLLVASAWFLMRAIESGKTKHLVWCGALVGLAFMTKMLQGWMVVPALAATYAIAGPPRLLTRVKQLLVAGTAMVAVSAAWPLAVTLWPGSTPYIGGSTNGSVWDLIFGYNGFGRLTGSEGGAGGRGGSFGGLPGLWRMFNQQVGGQIAWLIPLAAISLVAGLWVTRRAPRTDVRRAGLVLFGVWAIVHIAVFSSQKGIFHPYYVSALAPAIAALSGIGIVAMLKHSRIALALSIAGTAALAVVLLNRTPDFAPALRIVIPAAAVIAILGIAVAKRSRAALATAAVAGAIAIAAGPASYAVANLGHALDGNNVLAGPSSVSQGGMGGPGGGGSAPSGARPAGATLPSGARPSGGPPSGGTGGAGGSVTANSALTKYLIANQGSAKYLVAASGSHTTASIIIATGKPVVTIGGFNGQDPAPTVSQLAAMVKSGELKYVLVGSGGGGPGGGGSSTAITTWVKAHGKAVTSVTTSGGTLYEVSA